MNETTDTGHFEMDMFAEVPPEMQVMQSLSFWVGYVGTCVIAIPGLIMNIAAIFTLAWKDTGKSIFNNLVMFLFAFDGIYLVPKLLGILFSQTNMLSKHQWIVSENIIFPLIHISLAASIFMTVGIAHERYAAIVKNPIIHRNSLESAEYRRTRFRYYVIPIVTVAILFNIPTFFKSSVAEIGFVALNKTTKGNRYVNYSKAN